MRILTPFIGSSIGFRSRAAVGAMLLVLGLANSAIAAPAARALPKNEAKSVAESAPAGGTSEGSASNGAASGASSDGSSSSLASPKDPVQKVGWSFVEAGLIPMQSSGRTKPIDSFARETVLFMTGSRSFAGWQPVDLLFSWMAMPREWENQPFIQVTREDVRRQLQLDEKRSRFSPRELFQNYALSQYARLSGTQAQVPPNESQGVQKADPREQELKRLLDRLGLFRAIVHGDAWLVIPSPAAAKGARGEAAAWFSLAQETPEGEFIRSQFAELFRSYQADDPARFERTAKLVRAAVEGEIPSWNEGSRRRIQVESFYNRSRPFLFAWILFLLGAILWAAALVTSGSGTAVSTAAPKGRGFRRLAFAATYAAVACLVFGITLRCYVAGRPPVTNMYESIIWVSLGVVFFALILYAIHRQGVVVAVACALAALGLVAADAAPAMMDPGLHPLVPVLRSNYWLTIHVLTITLGYAAFALTLGLANVTLFYFYKAARSLAPTPVLQQKIAAMNQLTYRAMQFGVVLLAAGTILGGVWADYSWGRFWGWDPKEVWALIALLCYLAILHGRFTGWVTQFGYAAWTIVAFLSVLMAWYGVNFVLGAGLHSYGFSSGGATPIIIFIAIQFAYIAFVALVRRQAAAKTAPPTPAPAKA